MGERKKIKKKERKKERRKEKKRKEKKRKERKKQKKKKRKKERSNESDIHTTASITRATGRSALQGTTCHALVVEPFLNKEKKKEEEIS